MTPDQLRVADRITAYLSGGGLFNPELANHDAVRDLLIDARDELHMLRLHIADKDATISSMGATRTKADGALEMLGRIDHLKATTTVENMAKVAAYDPEAFKCILAAYMTDATDLKKARDEICRQQSHIDLMLDEFHRISLLVPAGSEIFGLCKRAAEVTTQKIPVIAQRDEAERRAERLKGHADRMRQILTIGDGGFPCLAVADYDAEFKEE